MNDPVMRMLQRLSPVAPDEARAERVRARCHAALSRRQAARQPKPRPAGTRVWEPALVAGLCLAYLSTVVRQALHLLFP